jgi:hypothetical protein
MDEEFIDRLREQENPFNDFVHAPANGRGRGPVHVPEINQQIQKTLHSAVRWYLSAKLDDLPADGEVPVDPPYSGMILILGKRGAGKTHLLEHGLIDTQTGGLLVAPRSFDPQRPFPEYVLHQLVQRLQGEQESRSTLIATADWLTRRILADGVAAMPETDWATFLTIAQPGWNGWKRRLFPALSSWAEPMQSQRRDLIARLTGDSAANSLLDICDVARLSVERVQQLARLHVKSSCSTEAIGEEIRRQLYGQLIDLAFSRDRDRTAIVDFLLTGFAEIRTGELAPSRGTLVEELLRALVDVQLLAGRPVILAFDALESLLGQPPEPVRCEAFHTGLAELVECVSGLPVFVFAERGHWERLQPTFRSEYAMQRWQRGIPVYRQGTVNRLDMPEIDVAQLSDLVSARMRPLQTAAMNRDPVDEESLWPFSRTDLEAISRNGQAEAPPLRQAIQQLRDCYEQLVFRNGEAAPAQALASAVEAGDSAAKSEPPKRELLTEELQRMWKSEFRVSERKLENNRLAALSDELHAGLGEWLACLKDDGVDCDGWRLNRIQNTLTGRHATYGQAFALRWSNADSEEECGIALLLGMGGGMPRDLESKLEMTAGSSRLVSSMRILWPRETDSDESACEQLPPASRAVWDEHAAKAHFSSRLDVLSTEALASWLTILSLRRTLAEREDVSGEVFRHFLIEQTQSLLRVVVPDPQESPLP